MWTSRRWTRGMCCRTWCPRTNGASGSQRVHTGRRFPHVRTRVVADREWPPVSLEDLTLYERVTRQLSEREWKDRNDYADAKGDVVQAILHRAEQWAVAAGWTG
jgi:hypothetical protein